MSEEVYAPLPGKIVKVYLEAGANVDEDDQALVIEAMKMETPVYVPCSGVIKEIRVKEGDEVEDGDVLALID